MTLTTLFKAVIPAAILSMGLAGCAGMPGSSANVAGNCTNIPGAIIGGIAGGAVGSQVGSGRGRDVAIAGGAATGAVIGSNVGGC
jgi:outer membrane lipoprotein SlyB